MFTSPVRKPDPDVIRVLFEYRRALEAKETAIMEDMAARWLVMENSLKSDMTLLAYEIQRLKDSGLVVTDQLIRKQARYHELNDQMLREIKKYNTEYAAIIEGYQRDAAMLGFDAAQNALMLSSNGLNFNRLNIDAIQSMIGFSRDGSPLYNLLKEDYGDAVTGYTNALIEGIARGYGPVKTAGNMADGFGMGLDRAILISRTETIRAYRTATTEQYRQSGAVTGFRRLVFKPTACISCLMLDGQYYDVAGDLEDHPRGKAELPGNLIISDGVVAFETIHYQGDAIIIRAASGKFLAVTPNHPVLTDRGWVAAKFVKIGDNVLSHSLGDGASVGIVPDKNHVPTVVEKIPSSFDMVRLGRMPSTAKNLYSQREDGKVDVIFSNRFLWNSFDAALQKQIKDDLFGRRDIRRIPFNALGDFTKMFVRQFLSSSPLLGVGNGGASFRTGHISPANISRFRTSASLDIVGSKNPFDNLSGNSELLSDSLFRDSRLINRDNIGIGHNDFIPGVSGNFDAFNLKHFGFTPNEPISLEMIREGLLSRMPSSSTNLTAIASNIVFDRVVEIGCRYFSGHVYSLQTKEEWYSSNNIISHNCTTLAVIKGVADPVWEKGPDYFKGLSPEEQSARMGPEKYELWKDGQFKLEDLSRMQHSDVWGDSPAVKTIEELIG